MSKETPLVEAKFPSEIEWRIDSLWLLNCWIDDAEYLQIYYAFFDVELDCYNFNGKKVVSNHEAEIFESKTFGKTSVLNLNFHLNNKSILFYYIGVMVCDQSTQIELKIYSQAEEF